jgi:RNA polymerase sigma factor (sigma-70 family)
MSPRLWQTAIERAGRLAAPLVLDELPDADLLGRFNTARDEPAFAAIVRRHGPLVWGICRGLSPTEADAEDAFQATFLALFRSVAKVRQPNAIGAWLHRVAGRVCRNGLRTKVRRAKHERAAAVAEAACPVAEAAWDRWQDAVHGEIDRLPDALRVPFVLCVLQGVRHTEAARRLGWKVGTVSGRVCKAKLALADAITRRGLTGAAGLAGVAGAGMLAGPLSAGMVAKGTIVVRSVVGSESGVSKTVHELARGATGGLVNKTKLLAAAVLVGALTVGAVGTRYSGTAEAQSPGAPPGTEGPSPGGPAGMGGGGARGGSGSAGRPGGGSYSGMGGNFASTGSNRVEYRFQKAPDGAEKFKSLLKQLGNDGWEYAGQVPGDDELIFKRHAVPAMGNMGGMGGRMGTGGMMGPGAMGVPGMGFGGGFGGNSFGGMPGGLGGGPGMPGGLGGTAPKAGGGEGTPRLGTPGGPPPGIGPGYPGLPPAGPPSGSTGGGDLSERTPEAGGGSRKGAEQIELRVGETIRHRMKNQIDRIFVKNTSVADVSADPTDARRVLIKALATGGTQLELTDAAGSTEKYSLRVR